MMFRSHNARKNIEPAAANCKVVQAAAERDAP